MPVMSLLSVYNLLQKVFMEEEEGEEEGVTAF